MSWLNEEVSRLEAIDAAPMAAPAAREHWKYSAIDKAYETIGEASVESQLQGVDVRHIRDSDAIGDVAKALLGEVDHCPAAARALLSSREIALAEIIQSPSKAITLQQGDARQPLVIRAHENTVTTIHDEQFSGASSWTLVILERGAKVTVERLRAYPAHEWHKLQIVQAADTECTMRSYAQGSAFRRHDLSVFLEQPGAQFRFTGATALADGEHMDLQAHIVHRAPQTSSRFEWRAIASGKATSTFRGRILIEEGASGADAELQNKNLAMSPNVSINSKPELEIYTDDVRCAHGSTVGQLDEEALFYLRARGVPKDVARSLLAKGFFEACLSGTFADRARDSLVTRIEA